MLLIRKLGHETYYQDCDIQKALVLARDLVAHFLKRVSLVPIPVAECIPHARSVLVARTPYRYRLILYPAHSRDVCYGIACLRRLYVVSDSSAKRRLLLL